MASYYRDHPLIADGNCEWGSQCSCSLNGRRHSYSIDLLRRTVSSVEMENRFLKEIEMENKLLKEIEDDATSTLVEVEEDLHSKKSPITLVVPETPQDPKKKKASRRICKKNVASSSKHENGVNLKPKSKIIKPKVWLADLWKRL
ncbi:unnamed protein product [Amaranthus hypochondriacus]